MLAMLNQRQSGILSSNTVQNPENDSHCYVNTTQSHRTIMDPCMPVTEETQNDGDDIDIDGTPIEKLKI